MNNYNLQKLKRKIKHEERKSISHRLNEYFANKYVEGMDKDTLRNELSVVIHKLDADD